eukprot:scaffold159082_cov31-Tisochrysis_lutea.AAC.1
MLLLFAFRFSRHPTRWPSECRECAASATWNTYPYPKIKNLGMKLNYLFMFDRPNTGAPTSHEQISVQSAGEHKVFDPQSRLLSPGPS